MGIKESNKMMSADTSDFVIDLDKMVKFTKGDGPIVAIDDSQDQIFLMRISYKKSGRTNEFVCFNGGEQFLEYLDKVEEDKLPMPEVALLDINMPNKNGFEILEEIRSKEAFKKIPTIVMVTASNSSVDISKAKQLNADAYFPKPSRIEDYIRFFQLV